MTTAQEYLYDLNSFQTPDGFKLGGKGPAMKLLASKIKVCFPTLNAEDKALFLDAVKRGPFAINKNIWAMFCEAVGVEAPTPNPAAPAAASSAPAPATNKVAGEILEHCQYAKVALGLLNKTIEAMLLTMERQSDQITALNEKVEAMKRPATKRTLASV